VPFCCLFVFFNSHLILWPLSIFCLSRIVMNCSRILPEVKLQGSRSSGVTLTISPQVCSRPPVLTSSSCVATAKPHILNPLQKWIGVVYECKNTLHPTLVTVVLLPPTWLQQDIFEKFLKVAKKSQTELFASDFGHAIPLPTNCRRFNTIFIYLYSLNVTLSSNGKSSCSGAASG